MLENELEKGKENIAKETSLEELVEKKLSLKIPDFKNLLSKKESSFETNYISIKDRPEDDRPREKMLKRGQAALSDAELLAILINTGTPRRSAIDLAQDVLKLVDQDLNLLFRKTLDDFQEVKGIGPAKAVTLAAALELGRRRQQSEYRKKEKG